MGEHTVTYSTELIRNYLASAIVAPTAKFEALQTGAGLSLLFSMSTENVFEVIVETPGHRNGWVRADLSGSVVDRTRAIGKPKVTVEDFAVAQPPGAAVVNMAMVVHDGVTDHLYLSLGNDSSRTDWVKDPKWVLYPYDDSTHPRDEVRIVGVRISEAKDAEYVVVDVLRDPTKPRRLVSRYYVDPTKADGHAWYPHDFSVDLDQGKYVDCLGRLAGERIDGFYTAGELGASTQFVYQPLYNEFDPGLPANPTKLSLPDGARPETIATSRRPDDSTDLYVTADSSLFLLESGKQGNDKTQGSRLIKHPSLAGVHRLFATATEHEAVVWGLNADDQVFYTSCPIDRITDPGSWRTPIPILAGVAHISPYVDRGDSANTFFAAADGNRLLKVVKSPTTTVWTTREITVEPGSATEPAHPVDSYTTRVQVTGTDGQPVPRVPVTLTASNVIGAHVDHLYYVLGPTPVHLKTDGQGSVTIIEPVDTLTGTRLTVEVGDVSLVINPMDGPVRKAVGLDTADKLTDATITYPDGKTKPLVPPGTGKDLIDAAAASNKQLAKAYGGLGPSGEIALPYELLSLEGLENSILTDAGDLLSWVGHELARGAELGIQLVEDGAGRFWRFVVTIAGQVYQAVLNTVEAVATAMQWLYEKIKTLVKDLIDFLKFLFEWGDIKRTQEVFRNFVRVYLEHHVDEIPKYRDDCDRMFTGLQQALDKWSGRLPDISGLGAERNKPPTHHSKPTSGADVPGSLLGHHFQGNADRAVVKKPAPPPTPEPKLIDSLLSALRSEGDTLGTAFTRLSDLAPKATSMPVAELLVQLVDIIGDAVISSAKNVVHLLLDVVHWLAEKALAEFEAPIHIPVLSDILSELGIGEFSFLDVVCWVGAIPATLAYKVAKKTAPFPDNEDTRALINAPDLKSLIALFGKPASADEEMYSALALSGGAADGVFVAGHALSGFCSLSSAIVSGFEAMDESPDNPWGIPSAVLGVLGGVTGGLANVLVPCDPVDNKGVAWFGTVVTGVRLLGKVIFSGFAQKMFAGNVKFQRISVADGRGVGSIIDGVLTLPALIVTVWHFVELAGKPESGKRSIAIIDETGSLTSYISRISYAFAVNDKDPDSRAVAVGILAVMNVCTGGLQIAEAAVHRSD